ncbi:hydantoinase/oxoprolinase N-terminal domain-containing protein [Chloroflexota bacterium]
MSEWGIGIDTGGTFTDSVALELSTGRIVTAKVPSIPMDPSEGLFNSLEQVLMRAGEPPGGIGFTRV